ncbi:MAG: META domain-containing protein [Acidimicrobiales bacterium]
MTRRTTSAVAALALVLVLAACSDDDTTIATDDSLRDRTFLSVSVSEDGVDRSLVADTRIRLAFEEDRISAHAGCNQLFGQVTSLDDGVLSISEMGGTEMGCDPALHDQDEWLMSFLQSSPRWTLDGTTLTLSDGTTTIDLLDRVEADPDRALEGTRWIVDTVFEGETAMSVPTGDEAYLVFEDGSFTGSTGCNDVQGTYRVDGDRVTFDGVITTDALCPETLELDQAVQHVTSNGAQVEIVGGRLTLSTDLGRGLGFHADDGSPGQN